MDKRTSLSLEISAVCLLSIRVSILIYLTKSSIFPRIYILFTILGKIPRRYSHSVHSSSLTDCPEYGIIAVYHSADAPWYNSRKATITLFCAGRSAGFACFRPNGLYHHFADASWQNNSSERASVFPGEGPENWCAK